jgi:hypothetical protein
MGARGLVLIVATEKIDRCSGAVPLDSLVTALQERGNYLAKAGIDANASQAFR